jgi:hypothetical protein
MPTPKKPVRSQRVSDSRIPVPVVGGRLWIALITLGAIGILVTKYASDLGERVSAKFETSLDKAAKQDQWEKNKPEEVGITLISGDFDKLACAYDKPLDGVHCQFRTESEIWPIEPNAPLDDNKRNIIQPFSLVPDNQLILLAGLWAQPAVAFRIHQEPGTAVAQKKQARFIAKCRIKPLERVPNASIRWNTGAAWGKAAVVVADHPDAPPWVAVAESCTVVEE